MHGIHSIHIIQNLLLCSANDVLNVTVIWCSSGLSSSLAVMMAAKVVLWLILAYVFDCEGSAIEAQPINERPIIGVLSQEQSSYLRSKFPEENYTSYIAASYVKDVEASGARVVPILIGKDRSYYRDLMGKINGVLMPGGATFFNQSNGYADAGQYIYEIAQEMNNAGDYFPIFGTCLGFELLIILASSGRDLKENRFRCYSFDNLHLELSKAYRRSKMFSDAPNDVVDILSHEAVTVNAHQFCIVDENMKAYNMYKDWKVTSHSYDHFGVKFIASVEHKRYPFYGVQFHPEKNAFEWKGSKGHPHSQRAIRANRYFMDFFVGECRKNSHVFSSVAEENRYLIYNYEPLFTGILGSAFNQCYMFEPKGKSTTE